MGAACSSNPYDSILQKYGQIFTQLIMAEKAKLHFRDYSALQRKDIQVYFQHLQQTLDTRLTLQIALFQKHFKTQQHLLDSSIPGGLKAIETQTSKKSFEEVLGYSGAISLITTLRDQTKKQMNKIHAQAIAQIMSVTIRAIGRVNESQPMIPEFSRLPQLIQKNLIKKAEEDFEQQIQQNNRQIMAKILPLIAEVIRRYKAQATSLNPVERMKRITEGFQNNLKAKLKTIIPENLLERNQLRSILRRSKEAANASTLLQSTRSQQSDQKVPQSIAQQLNVKPEVVAGLIEKKNKKGQHQGVSLDPGGDHLDPGGDHLDPPPK